MAVVLLDTSSLIAQEDFQEVEMVVEVKVLVAEALVVVAIHQIGVDLVVVAEAGDTVALLVESMLCLAIL